MPGPQSDIARVLARARWREGWILAVRGLGWGLAAAFAALAAGALALGRWPSAPVRQPALAAAVIALVVALFLVGRALLRRASSDAVMARGIGAAEPALRSDLLTAVELSEDRDEIARTGRYSTELLDAHVARTAERVGAVDLGRVFPARPAVEGLAAVAAVLLAVAAGFAFRGLHLAAGIQRLAGLAAEDGAVAARPPADPITGEIELTFRYPAYLQQEPRTLSGTAGEITAPRGTEVELRTRADRPVQGARLLVEGGPAPTRLALRVANGRDLAGRLLVDQTGSYRFQFTEGERVVASGPPIPITMEPDAVPEVRITAPEPELEVEPGARVSVEWTATDDHGLGRLTLAMKRGGREERRPVRDLAGLKRDAGAEVLDLAALAARPGERIQYWLEVEDGDTVSGPKRGASATQTLRVYSEAEHRRMAFEAARRAWEELIRHLADRLEHFEPGRRAWTPERVAQAQALDLRTKALHERIQQIARDLRRDRAAPRQLPAALSNVAAGIRAIEQDLGPLRTTLVTMLGFQRGESPLLRRIAELDDRLDAELEKDVLYLEKLLDQERAQDLVKLARDLQRQRRDLAAAMERYKAAPTEAGKQELLAEVQRLRARMEEIMRRMAEAAKGLQDAHMNEEALAELARGQDMQQQLSKLEQALRKGDVETAMRELDALASQMDQMMAGLERTAQRPSAEQRELMRELEKFQQELAALEQSQQKLAAETQAVKQQHRGELQRRLRGAEPELERLRKLAQEARRHVEGTSRGITPRAEDDFTQSRERLADLDKALGMRDLDAALDAARRAVPPTERLAGGLEEDVAVLERFDGLAPQGDPDAMRAAKREAREAVAPAREVRDALERLFPDPRSTMGPEAQAQLQRQGQQQEQLAQRAEQLRQRLQELSGRAPIFPPDSTRDVAGAREHMQGASEQLGRRDPVKGHGEQLQALDALSKFRRGMEKMQEQAQQQASGQGGSSFPYPMAMAPSEESGGEDGESSAPSQEKVAIPSPEAFKSPEAFRRDLMEAMKQGAPETYRGELQRYYEEIVK